MSLLGAVVVAGAAPLTARTLDSLVRQSARVRLGGRRRRARPRPACRRVARGHRLRARDGAFVPQSGSSLGARVNAGLAATSHGLVRRHRGRRRVADDGSGRDRLGRQRFGTRATSLPAPLALWGWVSTKRHRLVLPTTWPHSIPAHPALRSLVWRRSAVDAAGGFDSELAAALRYDLWLRLLARGGRGRALPETLVRVSVAEAEPLPSELASPGYRDAVRAVTLRHAAAARRPRGRCARSARQTCHDRLVHDTFECSIDTARPSGRATFLSSSAPRCGRLVAPASLPAVAQLGLRARRPSGPRLHRAVRPRARGRYPRGGARGPGGRLHASLWRIRRRAQRRPRPHRVQRRRHRDHRPESRSQYSGRHVRLRDPDPDASRHCPNARGRRRVSPHPETGRRPVGDAAVPEPRVSRIRPRRRLLACHAGRRPTALRAGVRRGRRGLGVRQRAGGHSISLRSRRLRSWTSAISR